MKKIYKKPVQKEHKLRMNQTLMIVISGEDDDSRTVKDRNNDFDDKAWEEY